MLIFIVNLKSLVPQRFVLIFGSRTWVTRASAPQCLCSRPWLSNFRLAPCCSWREEKRGGESHADSFLFFNLISPPH